MTAAGVASPVPGVTYPASAAAAPALHGVLGPLRFGALRLTVRGLRRSKVDRVPRSLGDLAAPGRPPPVALAALRRPAD